MKTPIITAVALALAIWGASASSMVASPRDSWGPGITSWLSPTFRQKSFVTFPRDVAVEDQQLDSESGAWRTITHYDSASFDIHWPASASRDRFCFGGFAENRDLVIQSWVAVPVTQWDQGSHVPLLNDEGLTVKRLRKTEIYRGPLADKLLAIEFDAEARFIMALVKKDEDTILYRFGNEPGAVPELVTDSQAIPELAQMVSLVKMQHRKHGRVWLLSDGIAFTVQLAFIDVDNDGVFEGPPLMGDQAFFKDLGFENYEDWESLLGP